MNIDQSGKFVRILEIIVTSILGVTIGYLLQFFFNQNENCYIYAALISAIAILILFIISFKSRFIFYSIISLLIILISILIGLLILNSIDKNKWIIIYPQNQKYFGKNTLILKPPINDNDKVFHFRPTGITSIAILELRMNDLDANHFLFALKKIEVESEVNFVVENSGLIKDENVTGGNYYKAKNGTYQFKLENGDPISENDVIMLKIENYFGVRGRIEISIKGERRKE